MNKKGHSNICNTKIFNQDNSQILDISDEKYKYDNNFDLEDVKKCKYFETYLNVLIGLFFYFMKNLDDYERQIIINQEEKCIEIFYKKIFYHLSEIPTDKLVNLISKIVKKK